MDKLSRKLLKISHRKVCSLCDDWDPHCDISFSELQKKLNADEDQILACVEYLVDQGYAVYHMTGLKNDFCAAYQLTHEGNNFKEFRRLSAREKWIERAYGFFAGVATEAAAYFIIQAILNTSGK